MSWYLRRSRKERTSDSPAHVNPPGGVPLISALSTVILVLAMSGALTWRAMATPQVTGLASSSVIPCLPVGPEYLGADNPNAYTFEQEVWLYWTGAVTSARLLGNEFNAGGTYGRFIYVNGTQIGQATGTRGAEMLCRGFEGREVQSWPIANPAILQQGRNVIKITLDPTLADKSWGLSRAQIEVTGTDVNGRHYRQVTVPSSYFNNWSSYQNEGTWTHIMTPSSYDPARPTPLLIAMHGYGSDGLEVLLEYHDAAESRGWLLASADYHGEVWYPLSTLDAATFEFRAGTTGRRNMGSRAMQWDILDIVNYVQAHYNVDPARIYLVGHSMGGMTALLASARWADRFAAIVSDSGPTDLVHWEKETQFPDGATANASANAAIRAETGTYTSAEHRPVASRVPDDYPFEYERRSPVNYAANFKHLPLLILHPQDDQKVLPPHAEDLYLLASQYSPDHLERVYFAGGHGDRMPDFANYTLDWLGQFSRQPSAAPAELSFATDWSNGHFWLGVKLSADTLREAHWVRVNQASYDLSARTIAADIENLRPLTRDYQTGLGVLPPTKLDVTLEFDLARVGLPTSGTYTVERVGKDDGSFSQTFVTPSGGKLSVTVPQGAYIVRVTVGDRPPETQVITLRQGLEGYTGVQDTYLSSWQPTTNYASYPTLQLYYQRSGTTAFPALSPLFKFDLSRVPAGAYLRYATFSVRVNQVPAAVLPVGVYGVNRPWKVGETNWDRASASALWARPGAEGVPQDRAATPADERTLFTDAGIALRYGFDVTEIVAGWLALPATNQGFLLRSDPIDGLSYLKTAGASLSASDISDANQRPFLTLLFTMDQPTATPSPTPTSTSPPTSTPTPTKTPTTTSTPTPTFAPTVTPTPEAGQIVGILFLDVDRDGQQDAEEVGLPGRLIQLQRDGEVFDNVTTGADGRYAFAEVRPGPWQVLAGVPAHYVVTTGDNPASVLVSAGTMVRVDFGLAQIRTPTATATATSTPTATASPTLTPTSTPEFRRSFLPLIVTGG
ncbi:MAG: hypothetical protein CVU38_12435 [Chloroflexi bacterium HGW-Chloroflexi-1]|nr:MAG: hypothetical protein CVU38_12435 [Chloroflexi bacterium HGW-Chloroflexi-1]